MSITRTQHPPTSNPRADSQEADFQARRLVSDLHTPNAAVYWTDATLSALVGWVAFAMALIFKPWSWQMLTAAAVAVFALYRGLCFLHEITHLRQRSVRGFETAWNLLFGVPLLMPSFVYVGVHQSHHKLSTYGTTQDPEYLPFFGKKLMITLFSVESLLLPLGLLVRFVLLAPFSLTMPSVHRWLIVRASAFCMNVKYRREATEDVSRKIARWEAVTLGVWAGVIGLAIAGVISWRFFVVWYLVVAPISFVNTMRTLGAHRYASDGQPLNREDQLSDSIDTPGAFWTELWAPVGLRYHALHHYFPGIPYHNLKRAHQRLIQALPPESRYSQANSPSLPHSLQTLYTGPKD